MSKFKKKAAAISYNPKDSAPKITALGKGEIAEKILKTAEENDIPVVQNLQLIETLLNLDIGDFIPPELYTVVAEILIFISDIDRIKGETNAK